MPRCYAFMYGFVHMSVMLGATVWASMELPIWKASYLFKSPWYIATLVDTYLGFFLVYLWLLCVEPRFWRRLVWGVLFIGLGNIAIGLFIMIRAYSTPPDATFSEFLLGNKNYDH